MKYRAAKSREDIRLHTLLLLFKFPSKETKDLFVSAATSSLTDILTIVMHCSTWTKHRKRCSQKIIIVGKSSNSSCLEALRYQVEIILSNSSAVL